eukprot:gene26242-biopygen11176
MDDSADGTQAATNKQAQFGGDFSGGFLAILNPEDGDQQTLPPPEEVVTDMVLRTLRLEAPICDISAICSFWHSIVVRHLAELLILRDNANMISVLRRALKHNKFDVALDLVSRPGSLDESEEALVSVAQSGQADLVRYLLHAPQQHAVHADCQDGLALVAASEHGHIEVVSMLLDDPQHAVHADCQDGRALVLAAHGGHTETAEMDRHLC